MPNQTLDEIRDDYVNAGMSPEEAPEKPGGEFNRDAANLEELAESYKVSDNGWYELPGGNKVRGIKSAVAVLEAHYDDDDLEEGEAVFACIQHPDMSIHIPKLDENGEVVTKTEEINNREREVVVTEHVGRFENAEFRTKDPHVIEELSKTNYVVRKR